ncbi:MAG: hypothetical protein LBK99_11435 [Opitutaceae bacterium]|jgi:hypothetical protein|nr:hypothetical protein [Opitutaceae bacterium]
MPGLHPVILCALASALALALPGAARARTGNLIANGDFESGDLSGWNRFIPTGADRDAIRNAVRFENIPDARSGRHAAQIASTRPARIALSSRAFPVRADDRLHVSAWVMAAPGTTLADARPGPALRLLFYKNDGKTPSRRHTWTVGLDAIVRSGPQGLAEAGNRRIPDSWTQLEMVLAVPADAATARLECFSYGVTGATRWDDVSVRVAPPDLPLGEGAARFAGPPAAESLARADATLPALREASLALLAESRRNNPAAFDLIFGQTLDRARAFLRDPLKPVDMSRVIGSHYNNFNQDIWRYRTNAEALLSLALAHAVPGSPEAGNPDLLRKAADTFGWLIRHTNDEGDCQAPDKNINRFHYPPAWEAFVLLAPSLPEDTRRRTLEHLLRTARFQFDTYNSWRNGYPNMDSAYLLILQQAASLFDRADFRADIDRRLRVNLEESLSGLTWDYVKGWNNQARYTEVTLRHVGRLYQISGHESALRQIRLHADYFKYCLEPDGRMDFGMAPAIKHTWITAPWATAPSGLELVHRYAPTPLLQHFVDRTHAAASGNPRIFDNPCALYWLSAPLGRSEPPPRAFLRAAPESGGFQTRVTTSAGTLTVYANGRAHASDTRISAMVAAPSPENSTLLAGALFEVVQDGTSFFLGDMNPDLRTDVRPETGLARLSLTQRRHSMGPSAEPLVTGGVWGGAIQRHAYRLWDGGSPRTPPVETGETWTWANNRLTGEISFTALEETPLDAVRFSLVPAFARSIDESLAVDGGGLAYRMGHLCFLVQPQSGHWQMPRFGPEHDYDWRADLPDGNYRITLISGDASVETEPFRVRLNGTLLPGTLSSARGYAIERSFDVTVADGSLRLTFLPERSDAHWKISAIRIDADAAPDTPGTPPPSPPSSRTWSVGGDGLLSGRHIYTRQSGFGWKTDMTRAMRQRGGDANNPVTTLITSPLRMPQGTFIDEGPRDDGIWPAGARSSLRVTLGLHDSLATWLAGVPADAGKSRIKN